MICTDESINKTDEELVALVAEDQDNFIHLMRRYEDRLMRYIFRISGVATEEAEDILQEVFIKIYKNLNDFDPDLKFSSWIYRITRNHTISQHRRSLRRPEYHKIEDEKILHNIAGNLDMVRDMNLKIDQEKMARVFEHMDQKYREILVLKYIEEKDYQEISDILEKPMGTVATLINRGKKNFLATAEKLKIDFSI